MSQRSSSNSRSRPNLDLRRAQSGGSNTNSEGARAASLADELFSDGSLSQELRPPSPGLPLHRDPGMSNLELHDTAAGVSSRRRGNGGAFGGASSLSTTANGDHSTFAQEEQDFDEKDYLMDRPDASTSKSTLFSTKEKEKWSKLIPEDIIGGSSSSRTRTRGAGLQQSGLKAVVSGWYLIRSSALVKHCAKHILSTARLLPRQLRYHLVVHLYRTLTFHAPLPDRPQQNSRLGRGGTSSLEHAFALKAI